MMNNSNELSFYKVLMEGIQDMVFIIRVEKDSFYYEFLNRAAMEQTGLTNSVIGKMFQEIYEEETANFLYEKYKQVVQSLESITYQDYFISPLGEKYFSETKLTPLVNKHKRCTHIVALVQDITEKKWAETEIKEYWQRLNESNQRFKSLFYYNLDAIFSLDLSGKVITGNAAVESVSGYSLNELIGTTLDTLAVPEDREEAKKYFQQALEGSTEDYLLTMSTKAGKCIKVIVKFTPIKINGDIEGIYVILKDVTEHLELTKKFEESEKRFRIIAEHARDLITLLDHKGEIIYVSPSYKDVLGYDHKEFVGELFFHNVYQDDINLLENALSLSITSGQPCNLQFRQKHRTKGWIWSEMQGTPVFDEEGCFSHMVVVSRDITLRKENESKLEEFAYHDPLTNLPNRRLLNERLTMELKELPEKKKKLAMFLLDIDYFKQINDRMGHDIGDEVIVEFGKRLTQCVRENDTVARLGGDEFVVLLPNIGNEDNAIKIAESIMKAMQRPWNINKLKLKVTTTIGIAMSPLKGATVSSMLKNADNALYKAKKAGRNTYKIEKTTDI